MPNRGRDLSQLFMQALSLSENGVAIFSPSNTLEYYNPAFAALFGFQEKPILGRPSTN